MRPYAIVHQETKPVSPKNNNDREYCTYRTTPCFGTSRVFNHEHDFRACDDVNLPCLLGVGSLIEFLEGVGARIGAGNDWIKGMF